MVSQSQPLGRGESAATSGAEPSAAFTPGPWEYISSTRHCGPYVTTAAMQIDIADCYWRDGQRGIVHHENGDANARLIAAAPDLLAALERTSQALRLAFSQKPLRDMAETLAEADAAIAKALGATAKDGTADPLSRSGRTPK